TVMSFNVKNNVDIEEPEHMWTNRRLGVFSMINQVSPMLIGLQECYISQRDEIIANSKSYAAYGVGRDNGKEAGETTSILWHTDYLKMKASGTFWLSESPDIPTKGWDAKFNRTCTWMKFTHIPSNSDFFLFNTHLDHEGTQSREKGVALILSKMAELNPSGLPVFLTGDFNCQTGSVPITTLTASLTNARPDTDRIPTSHAWGTSDAQIDFIFFSGTDEKSYRTLRDRYEGITYISDHYPIIGEFLFKQVNEI
ncbi:MAG: endonuclease/exonuclease/phosphatase family protein, partial [Bacteroidales bacterium]|nr:endonuclease/exonuclease/phosphatase family protein [Bacteroidales bacterium]